MNTGIKIAIDGPASSGKSTIARKLAKQLNYVYLDTGAMYRSFTLNALKNGISAEDRPALKKLLITTDIDFAIKGNKQFVLLNGEDVTRDIRSDLVSQYVSAYSAEAAVRESLVEKQQKIANNASGIIMDGRDIGTVVLPDAEVKIFLTASSAERAKRRFAENQAKDLSTMTLKELEADIKRRDDYDASREVSPLKAAVDSVRIDTSSMSLNEVEAEIMKIVKAKIDQE